MNTAPSSRYTGTAIVLHWVLGVALLVSFGVGWYMSGLPLSPWRLKLYNWHKWAGMTILALSALRLVWRLTPTRSRPLARISWPPCSPAEPRRGSPQSGALSEPRTPAQS